MPRAHWMTDDDYKKYERCLKDLEKKGVKGINKYAVCMAAIKKGKEKRIGERFNPKGNSR